jgi:hypothetical protein
MAITVNATAITFNDATTQTTAGKTGTVTSVATGNGLSGGTITGTGTLVVACPTFNSVGSYCFVTNNSQNGQEFTGGSNYSAGTGASQFQSCATSIGCNIQIDRTNNLSGTWKWMSGTTISAYYNNFGIACRVS